MPIPLRSSNIKHTPLHPILRHDIHPAPHQPLKPPQHDLLLPKTPSVPLRRSNYMQQILPRIIHSQEISPRLRENLQPR